MDHSPSLNHFRGFRLCAIFDSSAGATESEEHVRDRHYQERPQRARGAGANGGVGIVCMFIIAVSSFGCVCCAVLKVTSRVCACPAGCWCGRDGGGCVGTELGCTVLCAVPGSHRGALVGRPAVQRRRREELLRHHLWRIVDHWRQDPGIRFGLLAEGANVTAYTLHVPV